MAEFTVIHHGLRKRLGISWMEYGLCDIIHNSIIPEPLPNSGWCVVSRKKLAQEMEVSKRTIIHYLKKLESLEIVEKDLSTGYLRTTDKWGCQNFVNDPMSIIDTLTEIDQIGFFSIRATPGEVNKYGALSKYLRIRNYYKDPGLADFFRMAATLAQSIESYVSEPYNYAIKGHLRNADIIERLDNGDYGFTIWDFFDEYQISIIPDYLKWICNPDYTIPEPASPLNGISTGNVYLMRNNRNGHHKIGFTSKDPKFREATLQSQEPEVELIWSIPKDMAFEKYLHEIFAEKRLRGEWFDLDDNDLQEIFEMESDNE